MSPVKGQVAPLVPLPDTPATSRMLHAEMQRGHAALQAVVAEQDRKRAERDAARCCPRCREHLTPDEVAALVAAHLAS